MNPIKLLKDLAIAYKNDDKTLLKFYNNCLLLFLWMAIVALIAAYLMVKS